MKVYTSNAVVEVSLTGPLTKVELARSFGRFALMQDRVIREPHIRSSRTHGGWVCRINPAHIADIAAWAAPATLWPQTQNTGELALIIPLSGVTVVIDASTLEGLAAWELHWERP